MRVTPSKEFGPIAGSKDKIYEPGETFEIDDVRGQKLIMGGKAELVSELTVPALTRRRVIKAEKPKQKKRGKRNADSDRPGGDD
jgi:hypothetical protein